MPNINDDDQNNDSNIEIVEKNTNKKDRKKYQIVKNNLPLILLIFSVSIFSLVAGSLFTRYYTNLNKQSTDVSTRFNGNYGSTDSPISQNRDGDSGMINNEQGRGGMMRYYSSNNENSTNRISGVVISVGDGTFKIAGNGDSYTVNTTDSTTFNNSSKTVTVNDSVIIFGTLSDSIMSATSVRVINM